jgi:hypothetical protein
MCLLFEFLFQESLLCLFYCLKMAFVCEFQHIPFSISLSQGFLYRGYEVL